MAQKSTKNIRIGFIGAGGIVLADGPWGLANQFTNNAEATIVGVADINDENRREARDQMGLESSSCYSSHEELIDNESLDAVVVSTPHTLHYDHITAALDRDLHVYCEKPLVTNVEHARDLVDRTDGEGTILMIGYQYRLYPAYVKARKFWNESDKTPQFITGHITQSWAEENSWRTNPDMSGGGFLYDTGSHLLDIMLWTVDLTPDSVSSEMRYLDDDQRIDTQCSVNIRFQNDAIANLSLSGDVPRVRERLEVWDDMGATVVTGREWNGRDLTMIEENGDERSVNIDNVVDPDRGKKASAFIDSIIGRREPPANASDGLRVAAVTEAAYESARTAKPVSVELDD